MKLEINNIPSYNCNYELKNELENKTFYTLTITIYPKFSDERILSIIGELDNR